MRSGLPGPSVNDLLFSDPNITQKQLLEKLLPTLPFPMGFRSHFAYQNLLFLLAAPSFPNPYQTFLQKEVLAPLAMNETLTSNAALQKSSNKAYPHISENNRYTQTTYENLDAFFPAAGLISNASDMIHFLKPLLNHGTYGNTALLSKTTAAQIFTPQTTATTEEFVGTASLREILFPTSQFINYGLGCFIHDYRGLKVIHVPGQTDGASSVLAIVPSLNLGIFIATNAETPYFDHALLYQLIDAVLGQNTDWNTIFHKHLTSAQ